MNGWTATFALSAVCVGLAGASFVSTTSCSWKDEAYEGPDGGGNTGDATTVTEAGTFCGSAGQPCCLPLPPGEVPHPECDDGDETQCKGTTACDLSKCQAVSTTAAGCEALTTNPTTGPLNFRMRRIILVAPPNLVTQAAQNTVVNTGVSMNEPQCGSVPSETGDFSWLLSLDTTAMTVKTGGAPPCDITDKLADGGPDSCNPFTTGYCFVNKKVGSLPIAPVTAPITKNGDTYSADGIGTINIPIYFQGSIIVLPINGGKMTGVKVSADGNCIGSFNPNALHDDCSDDYTACSLWKTDGAITGYITLEQADTVTVSLLNATLCAFLTGTPSATQGALAICPRDANNKITAKGDYCSNPQTPGGCQDSFWLAATFAASAVKINDGTNVPDCHAN